MLKTKEQYHEQLFCMRSNIYISGELVGRDERRLRPGINVLDVTFDLARDQEWKGIATAKSSITGEEINLWAHLPQNSSDLIKSSS